MKTGNEPFYKRETTNVMTDSSPDGNSTYPKLWELQIRKFVFQTNFDVYRYFVGYNSKDIDIRFYKFDLVK